jgi:hypothetical protein
MCAPSAPPPPDYTGAAQAQGQASKDAALATGQLSNPNINSPQGQRRVTYTIDPTTGNPVPTITDSLNPQAQSTFDKGQQLQGLLADLGLGAGGIAKNTLSTPLDFNGQLGTLPAGRQAVIDSMMSRYDEDLGRARDQKNSDMVAAGIRPGTKAYDDAMFQMTRGRNDALQQATIAADQKSMEERRQAITELLAQRQTPLNEISAFRTGSQIAPLNFQPYTGSNVAAAPVFNAAQAQGQYGMDQYGIDTGTYNNMIGGLFALGSAYAGAPRKPA